MILVVIGLALTVSIGLAVHYHHQWKRLSDSTTTVVGSNGAFEHISLESDPTVYQTMFPDFYAPQSYSATQRESGVAYLTFNCSPSENTQELLDILAQEGAEATFFISGSDAPDAEKYLNAIVDAGHTVGMLSWTDDYASLYSSVETYLTDMYEVFTFIKETTGITPTAFRFPGGSINSYNAGFYQELIAEMVRRGFVPYDWNIDATGSDAGSSSDALVSFITTRMSSLDRAVIVLSDHSEDGTLVADALPPLLSELRTDGFVFQSLRSDTLPVLFAYPD